MDKKLKDRIMQWHEADEHEQIIDELEGLDQSLWDYELVGVLGRAYNNVGRYEEAISLFMKIAAEGERDPLWHFRIGYAYFYSSHFEKAITAFTRVLESDPEDEDAKELLKWSKIAVDRDKHNEDVRKLAIERRAAEGKQPLFAGMDLAQFWDDSKYALDAYVLAPPTDELIKSVEEELGYKLPASYVKLIKQHNGGVPFNTCFPTEMSTSWAEDHIAITGIMGIGREKMYSLCGDLGSQFMIDHWGYPDIGVVICDCPSAGHDVVMLDYRHCGKDGEPEVIHVDQESNYQITFLAPDFESFIRGLVSEDEFEY
jgi:tetratricopeptide (TPR) repeat protein